MGSSVSGCRATNSFWIKFISLLFLKKTVMMMMMMTSVFFLMMIVTTTLDVVAIYVHVLIRIALCVVTIQISQIVSSIVYYYLYVLDRC